MEGPDPVHPTDATVLGNPATGARLLGPREWMAALTLVRTAAFRSQVARLLMASAVVFTLSCLVAAPSARLTLRLMSGVLLATVILQLGWVLIWQERRNLARRAAAAAAEDDGAPCYLANAAGAVLFLNRVARESGDSPPTVADALGPQVADARALVLHLQREALRNGQASDQATDRHVSWHLSARRIDSDTLLWRLERGPRAHLGEESLPMLTLDPRGRIQSSNAAFCGLVGTMSPHRDGLMQNPPLEPGRVHRIATASGTLDRLVTTVPSGSGGSAIYLVPPDAAPAVQDPDWQALEDLPVPLLRLSPAGLILAANRHARLLLPVPSDEARLSDLLEGLGRPVGEWVADVAAGRPTTGPQFLRGTGEHQDIFLRVALKLAGRPDEPHLLAVLDDVTELKSLEAQFVQSQKMQALGQLAGGVAHDFNNLLTAISGHSDLLLLRHDSDDPDFADLMQIRQNVNRAAGLVGQLLAFSRKQSMLPETLDLRVVLSDLTHLLNRLVGERVRLRLDHEPTLRCVRADKRQLEQAIMNLVVNARDAMPQGGEIRIETANHHLDAPLTRDRATVPPGSYVLVRVVDQGTGIPPERLQKIFEPFYTTKKPGEGTGLGLSTVYGIVKQSGAYVFVESEVGRGTTFTLWFPAHDRPVALLKAAKKEPEPLHSVRGTILLVEDEPGVRAFAARALKLRGHAVLEADSGEAALALLSDPDLTVDLILTDVILPDADGPTWVRDALKDRPSTRVVFMSGYAEDAFAEQKDSVEGSSFLPKPFSLTDLGSMVEEQLSDRASPACAIQHVV